MVDMTAVWRHTAGWNLVIFPVQIWLCFGYLIQQSVPVQSKCDPSMCERPQSTVRAFIVSPQTCYNKLSQVLVICNIGFKQNGDNYTATCSSEGVWSPEDGCKIDIFNVIVAASASLVAIFVFFWLSSLVCSCCSSRKQKRHSMSKIQGKPKKGTTKDETAMELGAAKWQGFANGHTDPAVQVDDDYTDDFTDDEEDIIPASRSGSKKEHIYMNHAVNM